MIVESADDHGILSPISIGINWSRNRSVKSVPVTKNEKIDLFLFSQYMVWMPTVKPSKKDSLVSQKEIN